MGKASELIVVGLIAGAHGVRGDVRVKSFTANPSDLFDYAPLLAETGDVLLTPKSVRAAKDHFVVGPEQSRQKEEWDGLKGTRLYVPRSRLPDLDEDEFYIGDLVGLEVYTGGEAPIGRIKAVLNHGAGDLLEIQVQDRSKPVLVPFTMEDVPLVDPAQGRIVVSDFELWADEGASEPDDA